MLLCLGLGRVLGVGSCLPAGLTYARILSLQVMSIEEVERIIGETQDAVEYQRVRTVCVNSCEQRQPATQNSAGVRCVPSLI